MTPSPGGRGGGNPSCALPARALEAVQAVHGPAARRHERHLGQPSAAVADHVVHDALRPAGAVALPAVVAALRAAARLVLQSLGRVELLLAGREHELLTTVTARQQLVDETNHCPLLRPLSDLPPID